MVGKQTLEGGQLQEKGPVLLSAECVVNGLTDDYGIWSLSLFAVLAVMGLTSGGFEVFQKHFGLLNWALSFIY